MDNMLTTMRSGDEPWEEAIVGRRCVLVSWDVTLERRPLAVWVNRLVYGREETVEAGGKECVRKYPGYVDAPGVSRVGQSVLLMPPAIGAELAERLQARRIPCEVIPVYRRVAARSG